MFSSTNSQPELSVIIPVLHEGKRIFDVLEHLQRVGEGVAYEVIVVDGDPQRSTIATLQDSARVTGIVGPQGRGSQMNAGVAVAQARRLLFLHADTQLPPLALQTIRHLLSEPQVVAGAFDFVIDSPRRRLRWMSRVASLRSQLTRIPYGDQAIFIERQVFLDLGGYPDIPIMEDVALMRRLRRTGHTIRISRDPVRVSPRRWDAEGILFCTLRNWTLLTLYSLGVSPTQLVHWYQPPPKP